jgi:endo-1,4-beta-D-glucanase Y
VTVAGGCKFPTPDGKSDSATDGDLDVAFGLLLADKQWGSNGAINYLAEGKKVIEAIKKLEMNPNSKTPLLGDWAAADVAMMAKFGNSTRPSDFMIDHFRAYGSATGDAFWMGAVDGVHTLVGTIQSKFSMTTGLLPDFVINTTAMPAPAPPNFLEDVTDGSYGYNSCRVPMRLVTDWVASGDPRAKAEVDKIVKWIATKTGGDPSKVVDGYNLAGVANKGTANDNSFEAPFGVAGIVDKTHQAWVDAAWKRMAAGTLGGYYGDSIQMISMIVMSGNWWAP